MFSEMNDEEDLLQEPDKTASSGLLGPGNLGISLGAIFSASFIILTGLIVPLKCDWMLFYRFIGGTLAGLFAAGIAAVSARHILLARVWESSRPVAGLIFGASIGIFFGLWLFDIWILLAASIGGGIGALVDAIVHRKTLEDGD